MNKTLRFRNLTAELLEYRNMYAADLLAGVPGPHLPQSHWVSLDSQAYLQQGDHSNFQPRMERLVDHSSHSSSRQSHSSFPGPGFGKEDRFLGGLGPQGAYINSQVVSTHLLVPMRLFIPTTILVIPTATSNSALSTVSNDSISQYQFGRNIMSNSAFDDVSQPTLVRLGVADEVLPSNGEAHLQFSRRDVLTTQQFPEQPQLASESSNSLSWYQADTAHFGNFAHEWLIEDFEQKIESLDSNDLESPNLLWQLDHHTIENLQMISRQAGFEPFTVNDNSMFLEFDSVNWLADDRWSRRDIGLIEIADQTRPLCQRHVFTDLQDVIPQLDSMMGIYRIVDMIHSAEDSVHEGVSRESELNYQAMAIENGGEALSPSTTEASDLSAENDRIQAMSIKPAALLSILTGLVCQLVLRRNKRLTSIRNRK